MIGQKLKEVRKMRGLTQADLAKATGASLSSIKLWEIDRSDPTTKWLIILADELDCSIDYLLGRSERVEVGRVNVNAEVQRYEKYLKGLNDEIQRNTPQV